MHIHFIGICGTAMGNVALMMRRIGHTVSGSDENVYPPMSDLLRDADVAVLSPFSPENLNPRPDLVVIGNRMSRGNEEVEAVLDQRIDYTSLPELLKRELLQSRRSIVVTGTHGKTTTSSMTAWILEASGRAPSFMIGGVPGNFPAGWSYSSESDLVVLEGDEYDTAFFDKRSKFVHYLPNILAINNIEFDHADIFSSLDEIKLAFRRLLNIVPGNGLIVANGDDPNVRDVIDGGGGLTPVETYGLGPENLWRAVDIHYEGEETNFTVMRDGTAEANLILPLSGEFNVRNALAATAIARHLDIGYEQIAAAFLSFRNARRRLELKNELNGVKIYDDFAHHPTAIRGTLRALRLRHPSARIWGVFEPRSNTTRRNVFQRELAECFDDADIALLARIDRLEELPVTERLDPARLVEDINLRGVEAHFLNDAAAIVEYLSERLRSGDVVVVMSNGGFSGIHGLLAARLGAGVAPSTAIAPPSTLAGG